MANIHATASSGSNQGSGTRAACPRSSIDNHKVVNNTKTLLKQVIQDRHGADAASRAFDAGLRAWAVTKFTPGSKEADDFGATKKVGTKDLKTKALAAEKAVATRKARNTMGPKAKLKVKGTLPPHGVARVDGTTPNPDARMPGGATAAVNGAAHPQQ